MEKTICSGCVCELMQWAVTVLVLTDQEVDIQIQEGGLRPAAGACNCLLAYVHMHMGFLIDLGMWSNRGPLARSNYSALAQGTTMWYFRILFQHDTFMCGST